MTKTRFTINALALFVFSLTFTALAQAQIGMIGDGSNIYAGQVQTFVKPSGADTNPCSRLLPCKTFGTAMSRTFAGGEVIAMESGVYDPFTITKAMTIVAPPGVHASIVSGSGNAITIIANEADVIVLRNLNLKGSTGNSNPGGFNNTGVLDHSSGALSVEGFLISGYSIGINFQPASPLYVRDTTVQGDGFSSGIGFGTNPSSTRRATLERFRVEKTHFGIFVSASSVDGDTLVTVRDSVLTENHTGIWVGSPHQPGIASRVVVENSLVTHNRYGIQVETGGIVWLKNSTVSYNETGLSGPTNRIFSQNNTIQWNQAAGTSPTIVN